MCITISRESTCWPVQFKTLYNKFVSDIQLVNCIGQSTKKAITRVFSLWTLALQHPCELHYNQSCNFQMTSLMTIEHFKVYYLLETIKIEILSVTPVESVPPGGHAELSLSHRMLAACRDDSLAALGRRGQHRNTTATWKIVERWRFYFFQPSWVVKSYMITSRDVTAVDISIKWQWYLGQENRLKSV